MVDLRGKRALVCGSTQGMGWACAQEMSRLGATLTLAARNEDALNQVVAELDTAEGQSHSRICQDFDDPYALRDKVADHVQERGPFHILLNNTGGPPAGPILDADPEEFRTAFTRHLICSHLLAQTLVPGMKKEKYGRIINIISTSVKTPIPGLGVSNTIRGAMASWAKTLAGEVAPHGITVNNILPGFIDTARLHSLAKDRAERTGGQPEEVMNSFIRQIPAGRLGSPDEVAYVVCFLASPAAAYVNGINVPVDGGRTPTL